jgi:hypothetical protein
MGDIVFQHPANEPDFRLLEPCALNRTWAPKGLFAGMSGKPPFTLDQSLGCVCVPDSMTPDLKKMRLTEQLRQGNGLI